jgi:hypothetical protein
VLVIDPGAWSEPQALIGADAVLVSHEHVKRSATDYRWLSPGTSVDV